MAQPDVVCSPRHVRHWALWRTPRAPLALILSVELLTLVGLTAALLTERVVAGDLARFALLLSFSVVYAEGADRVDRMRRFLSASTGLVAGADGLWCFAAALVLPVGLAGAFTVLVFAHVLIRAARHRSGAPFRLVYTSSTVVLAVLGVGGVMAALDPARALIANRGLTLVAFVLAVGVYVLVNQALVAAVLYLVKRPVPMREVVASGDEQALELATLCLGVMLAEAVVHAPAIAPLSLFLVVVIRRSSLVRSLQHQAMLDHKTGLLNATAWRHQSEQELLRAARHHSSVTAVMIDLDHFKQLNDGYGHLAGDNTLRAVATCITETLRASDVVGRYGGEEFVALLPGVGQAGAAVAAERLCERIRELTFNHGGRVSASIGLSTVDDARGISLDALVADADAAMYEAKNGGRDRVGAPRRLAAPQSATFSPPEPSAYAA